MNQKEGDIVHEIKLPSSELKVMDYIWDQGTATAKSISEYMLENYEWKKNTTYTVLKNLVSKGAIVRKEPNFECVPLITQEQVAKSQTKSLLEKFYNGSISALFSSFLQDEKLSKEVLDEIKTMIEKSK